MAELKQGSVSISLPSHIEILPEAGKMTPEQIRSIEKTRKGIGIVCEQTAAAMRKDPERLGVPNLSAEQLESFGAQAEDIDGVIVDLEVLLGILKQNNLLLDERAQKSLRRVLAFVRSQEKFDPRLADLVPHLIGYFARSKASPSE